ncbi:MAG TPA: hypothetical protein VNJ04_00900, partial [Gemmatimonadaceae bacterium]|nr:hypothetical protein [Gemmatimonadaceae bacterium]
VVYVGATGMHPATRAWLHLHDPNPDIGRVAARYPESRSEPLDVIAVRLPTDVQRQEVKQAVVDQLAGRQLLSDGYVGDPPNAQANTRASAAHAARLVSRIVAHLASVKPE